MPKPRPFLGRCRTTLSSESLLSSMDFARNMLSPEARFQEPVLSAIRHATRDTHLTNHFNGPILSLGRRFLYKTLGFAGHVLIMIPEMAPSAFVMTRADGVMWCAADINQPGLMLRTAIGRDVKNSSSNTCARRLETADTFVYHLNQKVSVQSLCAFRTRPVRRARAVENGAAADPVREDFAGQQFAIAQPAQMTSAHPPVFHPDFGVLAQ